MTAGSLALTCHGRRVQVTEQLERVGGVATAGALLRTAPRRELDEAVRRGEIVRLARGGYALPSGSQARLAAHHLAGVAQLRSAAAHWGWLMKWQPRRPELAVPRGRRVPPGLQSTYAVSWRALPAADVVDGWVTSRVRTVLDCAALLPFDEALCIADSALAEGVISRGQLESVAAGWVPRGRARVTRVVAQADGRSANPFESTLRAITLDIPELGVEPQFRVLVDGRFLARVDLADLRLGIVLEADSFEFHGEPQLLERDCQRYDELVVAGWLVLRFSWNQVMKRPEWVRSVLTRAVALRRPGATGVGCTPAK